MAVLGIDPGLTGAIAALGVRGENLMVVDMPVMDGRLDPYALTSLFVDFGPVDRVVVESQQAYPRQGVSSSFKTGMNYGVLLGVLAALERPVVHVTAAVWTRALRVGADKGSHRRRACETWPAHADLFKRVRDDGRADAALLAYWSLRTALGAKLETIA